MNPDLYVDILLQTDDVDDPSQCGSLTGPVFVPAAAGPEAPPGPDPGSVLRRLLTQRQPDRQEPSGLPGDLLLLDFCD